MGKGTGKKWGQVFSLDPMSKAVNSQKALQRVGNNRGVTIMVQPQAGKHVTVVTLAGKVETASRFRCRSTLARGSSPTLRSVTLIRILGVYDFDMGEWEETPPSVHLSLPLTTDVHPCNLDNVTNLRKEGQEAELQEGHDLFVEKLNAFPKLYYRFQNNKKKITPTITIFSTSVIVSPDTRLGEKTEKCSSTQLKTHLFY